MPEKCDISYGLDEVDMIVQCLLEITKICSIIAISGDLGAGKTTLISKLLLKLGINEPITSPTFTYLITYLDSLGRKIYHFDLYRIRDVNEFKEAGFEEYLYETNSLVLIEWPEVIKSILYDKACFIELKHESEQRRKLSLITSEKIKNLSCFNHLRICNKS